MYIELLCDLSSEPILRVMKVLSIIIAGQYMWPGDLLVFGLSRHKAHAKRTAWGTISSFWVKTWKGPDLVLKKKKIIPDMPIQWRKAPCGACFLPIFLSNHIDPKSIIPNQSMARANFVIKAMEIQSFYHSGDLYQILEKFENHSSLISTVQNYRIWYYFDYTFLLRLYLSPDKEF